MPLNLALLKGCDIRGVFWGAWARLNPEKNRANLEKLVKWTAEGKISSHVDRTFPLAQTADALKVLAGRKAMGKVIPASVKFDGRFDCRASKSRHGLDAKRGPMTGSALVRKQLSTHRSIVAKNFIKLKNCC